MARNDTGDTGDTVAARRAAAARMTAADTVDTGDTGDRLEGVLSALSSVDDTGLMVHDAQNAASELTKLGWSREKIADSLLQTFQEDLRWFSPGPSGRGAEPPPLEEPDDAALAAHIARSSQEEARRQKALRTIEDQYQLDRAYTTPGIHAPTQDRPGSAGPFRVHDPSLWTPAVEETLWPSDPTRGHSGYSKEAQAADEQAAETRRIATIRDILNAADFQATPPGSPEYVQAQKDIAREERAAARQRKRGMQRAYQEWGATKDPTDPEGAPILTPQDVERQRTRREREGGAPSTIVMPEEVITAPAPAPAPAPSPKATALKKELTPPPTPAPTAPAPPATTSAAPTWDQEMTDDDLEAFLEL